MNDDILNKFMNKTLLRVIKANLNKRETPQMIKFNVIKSHKQTEIYIYISPIS